MRIENLRNQPTFADTVADRGWTAWWTDSGVSVAEYRRHLDPMIDGAGIPFCLVAQLDGAYAGSVLVIENDLESRPQYAPWIAALWVEPERRRQGIGEALLAAASEGATRFGYNTCYLCARPAMAPYYLARGFQQMERNVAGLDIFSKDA